MSKPPSPHDIFTLPEIAEDIGASYRVLHYWAERGMFTPSVWAAEGKGNASLYSGADARLIEGLVELRDAGLGMGALQRVAEAWRKDIPAICPCCGGGPLRRPE